MEAAFELVQRAFGATPESRDVTAALQRLGETLSVSHQQHQGADMGSADAPSASRHGGPGQASHGPLDADPAHNPAAAATPAASRASKMQRGIKRMLSQVPNVPDMVKATSRTRRQGPAPASDAGWTRGSVARAFVLDKALLQRQGLTATELLVRRRGTGACSV